MGPRLRQPLRAVVHLTSRRRATRHLRNSALRFDTIPVIQHSPFIRAIAALHGQVGLATAGVRLDSHADNDLFVTAINIAELLYGVARLPDGRRMLLLAADVERMVDEDLDHRVLPFDETAAAHHADIVIARDRAGQPISVADAQIAAICRSYDATLATRNVSDFANTGVRIVDP